jgi:ubiquinone/menaquinone biosynthesis C-methylase UbiE
MKRRPTDELLDTDSGTPAEVAASMRDLRWLNRWFGGLSTLRNLLVEASQQTGNATLTVLDVGAGDGFVADTMRREFESRGISLRFTLLDRLASHLPQNGSFSLPIPMPKIVGEALNLPFANASFDFVTCSLFLHHFAPQEVVAFGREALRVSKHAVLVQDLIRNPVHLAFAYAGLPLYRSRITRNDAPASVWQAYTVKEMAGFFREAGAGDIQARQYFFYRMGIVARKTLS